MSHSQQLLGRSRYTPKHQEEGRITRSLMNSGVIGKREGLDLSWPLVFFLKGKGMEHVAQSAIEPLCSPIAHGVVGCRVRFCNTGQMKELCNQVAPDIGALIGMYPLRETVNTEHIVPELFGDLLCRLIGTRECMSKFGEMVGDH